MTASDHALRRSRRFPLPGRGRPQMGSCHSFPHHWVGRGLPNVTFHCGEAKKTLKMSVRDWAAPFHCRNTASLSVGCSICGSMGAMPSALPHFLRWCAVTQCHGLCIPQDRGSRSSESGSLDLGSAETPWPRWRPPLRVLRTAPWSDGNPLLRPRYGVGASARSRPSCFSSAQSAGGIV
jgi:hypothetical protein